MNAASPEERIALIKASDENFQILVAFANDKEDQLKADEAVA
jgi:hypothetical protein